MGAVRMTFVGKDAGAQREIDKQIARVERLEDRVKELNRQSRRGNKSTVASLHAVAVRVGAAAAAYRVLTQAVQTVVDKNKELSTGIDQTVSKLDDKKLKLQIQAGINDAELNRKLPKIKQALLETPSATLPEAFDIERQLASSGFSREDIDSGKALDTVLQLRAATNQFGEDMGDVAEGIKAVSQLLKAQGFATPTAEQIRGTGGRLATLFEGSDIQFQDLGDLAKQSALLKELGLSETTQLAAFSTLRDVLPAGDAGTGLRQVASRLRGAGESKDKTDALAEVGLTPQDVDLIGEDLPTALRRMATAFRELEKTKPADEAERIKSSLLLKVFQERGQAAAATLIGAVDTIEQREELQRGDTFQRGVARFQESTFATRQRTQLRTDIARQELDKQRGGVTFEDVRNELAALQAERSVGADAATRNQLAAAVGVATKELEKAEEFGFSPLEALEALGSSVAGRAAFSSDAGKALRADASRNLRGRRNDAIARSMLPDNVRRGEFDNDGFLADEITSQQKQLTDPKSTGLAQIAARANLRDLGREKEALEFAQFNVLGATGVGGLGLASAGEAANLLERSGRVRSSRQSDADLLERTRGSAAEPTAERNELLEETRETNRLLGELLRDTGSRRRAQNVNRSLNTPKPAPLRAR